MAWAAAALRCRVRRKKNRDVRSARPQVRPPPGAVLLDCLGTLLALDPPAPRLCAELRRRGVDVPVAAAEAAMRAEVAYYLANHLRGRDRATLSALRDDCARVVAEALGAAALPIAIVREALLQALVFTPYPDVRPALIALRAMGSRLVVVSNWDCSLSETIERARLTVLLDGAVSSAQVGAAKPDPRPFHAALALARCEPKDAVMVGNSIDCDVGGARGVGIRPVLLARGAPAPDARSPTAGDVAVIEALDELASVI